MRAIVLCVVAEVSGLTLLGFHSIFVCRLIEVIALYLSVGELEMMVSYFCYKKEHMSKAVTVLSSASYVASSTCMIIGYYLEYAHVVEIYIYSRIFGRY